MDRTGDGDGRTTGSNRRAARSALAIVGAAMVAMVLFGGSSFGAPTGIQPRAMQTTESPSPSESASESPSPSETETPSPPPPPTGPAVQLLNPAAEPLPPLFSNELGDSRQVSDKFDGIDEAFHVVAVTRDAPTGAYVEAFFTRSGGEEVPVGRLQRVAGSSDTWELFWDIPEDFPQGVGDFTAKLFNASDKELDKDVETVDINTEEETVEMTWPANNGRLGFFKPRGGEWRTVIDGSASELLSRVYVYYSTTAPGSEPKWKECIVGTGSSNSYNVPGIGEPRPFQFFCALNPEEEDKDTPSQVTGFALIGTGRDDPLQPSGIGIITEESSDVHRVRGFAQDVRKMSIELAPFQSDSVSDSHPSPQHREAGDGCLVFGASVTDAQDRPVVGASIDVHLKGPDDDAAFGDTGDDGAAKSPDSGNHTAEPASDCDNDEGDTQGEHDDKSGTDVKHRESLGGTGMAGGGVPPGTWRFSIFSPTAGISNVRAWIDDAPLANEADDRKADDDKLGSGESSTSINGYWLAGPAEMIVSPASDSAVAGTCNEYTFLVQGGATPVRGINVDVHATGPTPDLDFCAPDVGSPHTAPEKGEHEPEDDNEAFHPSEDPEDPNTTQHTEGKTDSAGLFTIGIISNAAGDTTLEAWADGYPGQDDDVKGRNEVSATASKSWATSAQDAEVRFLNPSGYGGSGDNISNKDDGDTAFHIVTRVDLPALVSGVEIYLVEGSTERLLGDATRVGDTDTYEFFWNTEDMSGTHTLRAEIEGTDKGEEREVRINNELETINLTDPANTEPVDFAERKTTVAGTASAGAEGVTFYYTKTSPTESNESDQWTECGSVELATAESGTQPFTGECTLAEGDSAINISGIAALATTCDPLAGCGGLFGETIGETGDAHRVLGPLLEPSGGDDDSDPRGCTVTGNDDSETLRGTSGDDVICGNGGDDIIYGLGGNDVLYGGAGTDTVVGGTGDDRIYGGSGDDSIRGGAGSDLAFGGTGNDTLNGKSGNDRLRGNGGRDVLTGGDGRDNLRGHSGKDVLKGGEGGDRLLGGAQGDVLRGLNGNDVLRGQRGPDALNGGRHFDRCAGGPGRDRFRSCEARG